MERRTAPIMQIDAPTLATPLRGIERLSELEHGLFNIARGVHNLGATMEYANVGKILEQQRIFRSWVEEALRPNKALEALLRTLDDIQKNQRTFAQMVNGLQTTHYQLGESLARLPSLSFAISDELQNSIRSLDVTLARLGEVPLEISRTKNDRTNQLAKEIGEDAAARIVEVDYLPVSLVKAILDDPKILFQSDPREFEKRIAALLEKLGFRNVYLTPPSKDGGIDILASLSVHDIPILFAFECKQWSPHRKVQVGTIRTLLGTLNSRFPQPNKGVLVTTSTFTNGARELIASNSNLEGRDLAGIISWMRQIPHLKH